MNTLFAPPLPPPARHAGHTPVFSVRLRGGWTADVFDRVAAIDPALWQAMFPPHWKDYAYHQTLEETFPEEFPARYLVLNNARGEARAILPLFFVSQDLTISLHARLRAWLEPWRRRLTFRLLAAGCVVGAAQVGAAAPANLPRRLPGRDEALECFARRAGVSLRLWKDFPRELRPAMSALATPERYLRLASLPGVCLDLDFATFDEYVQTRLGKATRKSLRRKFREVEALAEPITLEVKTALGDAEAVQLHALYERVALRGDMQFEVFTKEYFVSLAERLGGQARYFVWRHAGRVVAFSFCVVHGGTIYDNDLGLDEDAAGLNLYHVTFRDIVRWALAHGLTRYESAPFNYDPKLHLRMNLVPLDLYARHTSPLANRLLHWLAPLAAPTRQEPLLRQFPNAAEI